jgi:hypothetical protein
MGETAGLYRVGDLARCVFDEDGQLEEQDPGTGLLVSSASMMLTGVLTEAGLSIGFSVVISAGFKREVGNSWTAKVRQTTHRRLL